MVAEGSRVGINEPLRSRIGISISLAARVCRNCAQVALIHQWQNWRNISANLPRPLRHRDPGQIHV